MVLPYPVYAYWCQMAMAGPCWVLITPPAVTIGMFGDLMIVNASDINNLIRLLNDANIITSKAFIGSSTNKQTSFSRFVGGDRVKDVMDLDLVVSLIIDHNFLFFGQG